MNEAQKEGASLEEMVSGLENRWSSACFLAHPTNCNGGKSCSCFATGEVMKTTTLGSRHPVAQQLLQNCDLPPPVKVFVGDETAPTPLINSEDGGRFYDGLDLWKAVRLSQTRAREAERQAALLCAEKEKLTALLWGQSSKLFAHRQWLKLLEMEVCQLRSQLAHLQWENQQERDEIDPGKMNADGWTVALLVGIACFGLAIGCKYSFLTSPGDHMASGS